MVVVGTASAALLLYCTAHGGWEVSSRQGVPVKRQ